MYDFMVESITSLASLATGPARLITGALRDSPYRELETAQMSAPESNEVEPGSLVSLEEIPREVPAMISHYTGHPVHADEVPDTLEVILEEWKEKLEILSEIGFLLGQTMPEKPPGLSDREIVAAVKKLTGQ